MCINTIHLDGLVRAARRYWEIANHDQSYAQAIASPCRNKARECPNELSEKEIRDWLIRFLNQWRTHCRKAIAGEVRKALIDIAGDLSEITTNNTNVDRVLLQEIFERLSGAEVKNHTFGPVATAKTLGILYPDSFCMWDNAIAHHYGLYPSGAGYARFLPEMKSVESLLREEWRNRKQSEKTAQDIEGWLAGKTDRERVSLLKSIDEYNWVCYGPSGIDEKLLKRMKAGSAAARQRKGRFVE